MNDSRPETPATAEPEIVLLTQLVDLFEKAPGDAAMRGRVLRYLVSRYAPAQEDNVKYGIEDHQSVACCHYAGQGG